MSDERQQLYSEALLMRLSWRFIRGVHITWHHSPVFWLERSFVGLRILGWQYDLRTSRSHRLFSERNYGCGYKSDLHVHGQRQGTFFGLCFRAKRMVKPRPEDYVPPA